MEGRGGKKKGWGEVEQEWKRGKENIKRNRK